MAVGPQRDLTESVNVSGKGIGKFQSDVDSNEVSRKDEQVENQLVLLNTIWSRPSKGRGKINSWF